MFKESMSEQIIRICDPVYVEPILSPNTGKIHKFIVNKEYTYKLNSPPEDIGIKFKIEPINLSIGDYYFVVPDKSIPKDECLELTDTLGNPATISFYAIDKILINKLHGHSQEYKWVFTIFLNTRSHKFILSCKNNKWLVIG